VKNFSPEDILELMLESSKVKNQRWDCVWGFFCGGGLEAYGGFRTRLELALTPKLMHIHGLNNNDEKVNKQRCTVKEEKHN